MISLIKEKFDSERENNTFRRVDSEHPINIFLGYNDFKQPTLAIIENGCIKNIESTKYIEVKLYENNIGNTTLAFSLLDLSKSIIFYKLCDDLIESSRNTNKESALVYILTRWNNWRQMFNKKPTSILSPIQIIGLLGELIVLNNYMIPKYGQTVAIQSWMGPDMSHKDFEVYDTWYEVKTINTNSLSIKISSVEQLDSLNIGYLIAVVLDKTNKNTNESINLNSYIDSIEKSIDDFYTLSLFRDKLNLSGYFIDEEYDEHNFNLVNLKKYLVNEEFPKIKEDILVNGIVKVSYDILINSISNFLVEVIHNGFVGI